MSRLNGKLIEFLPNLRCLSLPNDYTTISLLHIRSIVAKLPDIEYDSNVNATDILCYTETWLSPSQPSPCIKEGHIVLRCDRVSGNSKGGVLMSVLSAMEPSHINTFTTHGMEVRTTRLFLHNTKYIQIALLYRPPSVPLVSFTNVLTMLMNHMSSYNLPTVIMRTYM